MYKEKNPPDFYGLFVPVPEALGLKERLWAYFAGICDIKATQTQINSAVVFLLFHALFIVMIPKRFLTDILYPVSISTWFRGECTLKDS